MKTPRTLATQHFIAYDVNGTTEFDVVYAPTMEIAIAETKALFEDPVTGLGPHASKAVTNVRAAVGKELPWVGCLTLRAEKTNGECAQMRFSEATSLAQALAKMAMLYDGFSIRQATPAEAEEGCRRSRLEDDERCEQEIEYGFNEAASNAKDWN